MIQVEAGTSHTTLVNYSTTTQLIPNSFKSHNTTVTSGQYLGDSLILEMNEMMGEWDLYTGAVALVSFVAQMAMIFGGVVPYIPQYRQISASGDADGFSLYVCLALLTANILRIIFWFGKAFETPLLIQSILMSIAMLIMIQLCVETKLRNEIIKKNDRKLKGSEPDLSAEGNNIPLRRFIDFNMGHFWDWTDFSSYLQCITVFSLCGALLMFIFCENALFVETVGFLAVFVEAMLGVPQFLKNYTNQSTRGMNLTMVLMWTCGDVFKTTYFVLRSAPIQFAICGCLQVGVDLAILSQVWLYGGRGVGGGGVVA